MALQPHKKKKKQKQQQKTPLSAVRQFIEPVQSQYQCSHCAGSGVGLIYCHGHAQGKALDHVMEWAAWVWEGLRWLVSEIVWEFAA